MLSGTAFPFTGVKCKLTHGSDIQLSWTRFLIGLTHYLGRALAESHKRILIINLTSPNSSRRSWKSIGTAVNTLQSPSPHELPLPPKQGAGRKLLSAQIGGKWV